uniref:Uncharacterized protein n=1 Tax=viral metagenome TaxID=1070528 RepID=A0A6M3IK84_9ZZZZ
MSADNYIAVQRQSNGEWAVWMGFASEEPLSEAPRKAQRYQTEGEAMAFAHGWCHGASVVEYGVRVLPPMEVQIPASPGLADALAHRLLKKAPDATEMGGVLDLLRRIDHTLTAVEKSLEEHLDPVQGRPGPP